MSGVAIRFEDDVLESGALVPEDRGLQSVPVLRREANGSALSELKKEWTQSSGTDRKTCIATMTTGGFASYVELLTCLEMARDAASPNTNPDDTHEKSGLRTTQSRETGGAVGEGH